MYMYDLFAEGLAYLCQFEQPLQYVQHNVPGDKLKVLAILTDQSLYVQHHLVGHDEAVCVQHLFNNQGIRTFIMWVKGSFHFVWKSNSSHSFYQIFA